jgi:hypothetical protein
MLASCESDFGAWYEYPALLGCNRIANFYHDVVAGLGGDAFESSTSDRCQCYCNDRINNQLCTVNGNPTCVFINGNGKSCCIRVHISANALQITTIAEAVDSSVPATLIAEAARANVTKTPARPISV